jgi:hypothetical protein
MCRALNVLFRKLLCRILLNFSLESKMNGVGGILFLLRVSFVQPYSESFKVETARFSNTLVPKHTTLNATRQ